MHDYKRTIYTAIDLFCGSGAVTAALRNQGFDVLAALDNDPIACKTYRLNHPGVKLIEGDIRKVNPESILTSNSSVFGVDLLVFCAPCQPFSSQNRNRSPDGRARLLLEAGRYARALKPKCMLFENVPGLTSPSHAEVVDTLAQQLRREGYILSAPRRLDAAETGVPQRRVRCVMIASQARDAADAFQQATVKAKRRTVREAIGQLKPLRSGESDPEDDLHRARTHRPIALDRLRAIPIDGGSRAELPMHLRLKCHTDDHSFSDVYGRMRWDDVAPTLTTGCDDITRGRFAHPDQDRAITLREAALLQTFPLNYRFSGSRSDMARQIGNAVPVAMVEALAPILKQLISFSQHPTGQTPLGLRLADGK